MTCNPKLCGTKVTQRSLKGSENVDFKVVKQ